MVGQVGSQSRPGASVGGVKLHCVNLTRCPRGLRPMGSNASLGKECVGVGKTWISHFDPRALLVFVLRGYKTRTEDTRVENGGWTIEAKVHLRGAIVSERSLCLVKNAWDQKGVIYFVFAFTSWLKGAFDMIKGKCTQSVVPRHGEELNSFGLLRCTY